MRLQANIAFGDRLTLSILNTSLGLGLDIYGVLEGRINNSSGQREACENRMETPETMTIAAGTLSHCHG